MACLFKEHLLSIHFVHALVLELLAHAQAAAVGSGQQLPLHSQSMLAVGLVRCLSRAQCTKYCRIVGHKVLKQDGMHVRDLVSMSVESSSGHVLIGDIC